MYEPKSFEEFIGQENVLLQVRKTVEASIIKKAPVPHILLSGPAGTGKSTLARLIAKETGVKVTVITPAALRSNEDVFNLMNNALDTGEPPKSAIVFLDEVHRLAVTVEEDFYLPMENNIFIKKGLTKNKYTMPPWTLIAATTLPGKLSSPFLERFGLSLSMEKYNSSDIERIIKQAAESQGLNITQLAAKHISERSRRNPRIANHLLDRCYDIALVNGSDTITAPIVAETFTILGLDELGLTSTDRRYLAAVYKSDRPVGLNSLTPVLDIDKETLQNNVEPFLIESDLLLLTNRGRLLTLKGKHYVELHKEAIGDVQVGPLKADI